MDVPETAVARIAGFMHRNLIWCLIGAYVLAGIAPALGRTIRATQIEIADVHGQQVTVSLPLCMLALLLFNAGLGVDPNRVRNLVRQSRILIIGLFANLAVPLLFIFAISMTLSVWHNPTEVQYILVGLALIASMPVAGSSTAWAQNANGDLALSVGMVVGSTILSPITTPAVLHSVGWVADGVFADCLHQMAAGGTSSILLVFVLVPSLAGIAVRILIGYRMVQTAQPWLKVSNSANLLLLCYANAAAALPQTFANPDWDFLAIMLAIVASLCVCGFLAGRIIARCLGVDASGRIALMFGLGMSNNGTGLVVATSARAHIPEVMLPVIFYNLVQHVVAGAAKRILSPQ